MAGTIEGEIAAWTRQDVKSAAGTVGLNLF